ncbi:MAG: methyltransferase domain-containing protein [Bdellovibrionota bacterium]
MGQIWRMKKGSDRRIRQGHPWVFSHEIASSIKNFRGHEVVELQDFDGNFLARGYGNLASKIIFRAMSFSSAEKNPLSLASLQNKLLSAWRKRHELHFSSSFRLCFSEADEIPGLIIDRYLVEGDGEFKNQDHQVFAVQILTSGIQRNLPDVLSLLQKVCETAHAEGMSLVNWQRTSVVLRNDVGIRKLEGLDVEPPRFLKVISGYEATQSWIKIKHVGLNTDILMNCDLYQGQKTGFFLDQIGNISVVAKELENKFSSLDFKSAESFRILDLCCYVGHWSVQIGTLLKNKNIPVHSTLVDVSKDALLRAQKNMEQAGLSFEIQTRDVLKGLDVLPSQGFDLVIADPPAFVKAKKDLPTGKHAYQKLNSQAFRLVKPGGYVVSCSCSGLISEDDLQSAVSKAIQKNQVAAKLIGKGGPAADHPKIPGFSEGSYLKMLLHQVD